MRLASPLWKEEYLKIWRLLCGQLQTTMSGLNFTIRTYITKIMHWQYLSYFYLILTSLLWNQFSIFSCLPLLTKSLDKTFFGSLNNLLIYLGNQLVQLLGFNANGGWITIFIYHPFNQNYWSGSKSLQTVPPSMLKSTQQLP